MKRDLRVYATRSRLRQSGIGDTEFSVELMARSDAKSKLMRETGL